MAQQLPHRLYVYGFERDAFWQLKLSSLASWGCRAVLRQFTIDNFFLRHVPTMLRRNHAVKNNRNWVRVNHNFSPIDNLFVLFCVCKARQTKNDSGGNELGCNVSGDYFDFHGVWVQEIGFGRSPASIPDEFGLSD